MTRKSTLPSQKEQIFLGDKQNDKPGLSADETSLKYMLKLATPMVIMYVSFTIMQFVDRFMVSRLGTEALAAILPAGFISFVPASFALGVVTSLNTFVSQSLGRGNKEDCSNYTWQVIYMVMAYFLVVVVIMWPSAPWIFKAMKQPVDVTRMEVIYLRILLYAHIPLVFMWANSQFFMGIHRPIITMYIAIFGQVINVAANYILIFGKFGFPKMGIAGAGWGTFIGIAVEASVMMTVFLNSKINSEFKCRRTINIDFDKMKDLLKVGLPCGLELMVNVAFWAVILFSLVGRFGKEALAATSAVFACMNVSFMPIVGIGTALTAAVGKAVGAGRKESAIRQTRICLRIALVYMGLVGLCFFAFRNNLMSFWSSDDKVIEIGAKILICAAIFQVFDAAVITYNGVLRGAGDTMWLAIVAMLGTVIVLGAGGVLTVKFFPQLGPLGPWIAATFSIITVGLANRWRFNSKRWMKIDLFKRRGVEVPVEIEAVIE